MASSETKEIITSVAHALPRLGVKMTSSILVAVSGGVDSMTLLFILNELRKQGHFKKINVTHINHLLRGSESGKDEQLVKEYCKKLKIPLFKFQVDTRAFMITEKIGVEEAARHLRYEKFATVGLSKKINFIATAHNANDQAETVLMNIIRGAGLNGLQGIPESRKLSGAMMLIRPLLGISKDDIRKFAEDNNIPFREDRSNESLDFQRNRIRHQVFPILEKAFKGKEIYSGFSKMTRNIASTIDYINSEVESLRSKTIVNIPSFFQQRKITSFEKRTLLKAPDFIRRELIIREAASLTGRIFSIDYIHSALLESFIKYPSKKNFQLSHDIFISHDKSHLSIEFIEIPPEEIHHLIVGERILSPIGYIIANKVKGWNKPSDENTAYFKYSDITRRQLMLRYWKPGDKMKPFGMKGKSRLVSDILNEAGIKSERLKYFFPLIVFKDEPDLVLWIPGIRSAEFGRLSAKSETALQLRRII